MEVSDRQFHALIEIARIAEGLMPDEECQTVPPFEFDLWYAIINCSEAKSNPAYMGAMRYVPDHAASCEVCRRRYTAKEEAREMVYSLAGIREPIIS